MKKSGLLMAILLALAWQARAVDLGYTKDHPLLFGLDMDYPPMEYVDVEGIPHGYDVEFTQKLMRRLDIPFTYSPNTWENISGDVIHGRVDLGMMVYSPYREDITNYSKAVFRLYYQLVCRKDSKDIFNSRDLSGKSIAYMASRPISDSLSNAGAVRNVVKDLQKAFIDLSKGKYDAIICFRYQASYIIDRYELKNLTTIDMSLMPREYCYVSHNKELINAINVELDKMEAEGITKDIYGKALTMQFANFEIPHWIYWTMIVLVIVFLVVFIVIQHQHQKQLRKEMERAQRNERMKTVFLGNVSHALRTPLNSIIGFSDLLAAADEGTISHKEQCDMLKLINGNGQQLLCFINELLELSDIKANGVLFNRSQVNVRTVMEELAEETRGKLTPGVEMKVEGGDCYVTIDSKLMRLVTTHCLDNAAKFTKEGSVTLSFRKDGNGLRIEVADTGVGLPDNLRKNLFGLLSEKSTYEQNEIPGLGLSICKAIVDSAGGRIGADKSPSGGTVLWHWVPCRVV